MSFIPLADAAPLIEPVAPGWQLVTAALLAIALIVVLITVGKMHPFLALIFGGLTVGIVAGENINDVLTSFTTGFGTTAAGVGALIALGAMFAKLLADSGGADQIVDTIVGKSSRAGLPWAMAGVGALIGLPMFFEIGLVLLMPVIYLVARRAQLSVIAIGIPTLAGLSAMHGLVPPHPGPLLAIQTLNADLGLTLMFGVIVAIPTVVIGGPLFGRLAGRWVDVPAPDLFGDMEETEKGNRPSFGVTLATVLLPVVADDGQGDRRHHRRQPRRPRPAGLRRDRQPVRRAAHRCRRRDVHLRQGLGDGPRGHQRVDLRIAAAHRRASC